MTAKIHSCKKNGEKIDLGVKEDKYILVKVTAGDHLEWIEKPGKYEIKRSTLMPKSGIFDLKSNTFLDEDAVFDQFQSVDRCDFPKITAPRERIQYVEGIRDSHNAFHEGIVTVPQDGWYLYQHKGQPIRRAWFRAGSTLWDLVLLIDTTEPL